MRRYIEQFDEISRVCGNHRKVVVERVLPYGMIRPAGEANMRHGLGIYAGFGQSAD